MDNEQLLNRMQENIQMVLETIPEIQKNASDHGLKSDLASQESLYRDFLSRIRKTMDDNGYEIDSVNEFLKLYSEWMTKIKAMTDNSASHLAELCIEGYTMGMVKVLQDRHQFSNAARESLALALELADQHQKSIECLKQYL